MTILNLPAYYFPEQIASSHLTSDLENAYINAGFDIKICSPIPTRGITDEVYEEYKNKKSYSLKEGHINVTRFYMFREGKNPILRALRYVLVNIIQYIKSGSLGEIDVIVGASTPPTQGILCTLTKKKLSKKLKKTVPFIFSLQDVFPDSLVYTGLTKKGSLIYKIGDKIAMYTYKNADRIVVISEDFRRMLIQKGIPEGKIEVIYNWIDTDAVKFIPRDENRLFDEYGIDRNKFYIAYSGNIGLTQNMDMLLEIAEELNDKENIGFILVGDGAYRSQVEQTVTEKKLTNVHLLPFQPYERISEVFSLGDVGLLISKKGVANNSVPSKTWSYMAAERPVLASFDEDSELCRIITRSKCGCCADAGDKKRLKELILELANGRDELSLFGDNGRRFVIDNISKQSCTEKYAELIKSVTKSVTVEE